MKKVWLYKARDAAPGGERRPDSDATRAFATEDGILCRSAYTRGGERAAWISNVQYVEAGDIILLFFRQLARDPQVLFLGAFRVRDPGEARLNEECDLAVVSAEDLRARLVDAYAIPAGEPVTGWLLEPVDNVVPPPLHEPEIEDFLGRRASLTEYHGGLRLATERYSASSGRVTSISLRAVTLFEDVTLQCSPGINVLIGENSTGKTHVLKCAYALLRAAEEAEKEVPMPSGDKLTRVLSGSARSLFAKSGETSTVRVVCERATFERVEAPGAPGARASWSLPPMVRPRSIFLPSREALAMFQGFAQLYEEHKVAFDETYYDLCKELNRIELRELSEEVEGKLAAEVEAILGGPVRLEINKFVVDTRRGPIDAPMLAEGYRKLASLAYLIKNGALRPQTVLFWDEPEANLNPKLVTVVAQVIRRLASAGVQIFIATHDYLLCRELSMAAEYEIPPVVDTLFFALRRGGDGPTEVESATRFSHLGHNPILEEHAAHYDREERLFAGGSGEEGA